MTRRAESLSFGFDARVWEATGKAAWSFVTLPTETAQDIRHFIGPRRGWGSIRVEVTVGNSRWKTSIFPDTKRNSCLLPLKAAVRKAEKVKTGDTIRIELQIIEL
ncbi:MAG TPA: DUF1905 domain-containing protein [Gammaproteobacteria bacterium]